MKALTLAFSVLALLLSSPAFAQGFAVRLVDQSGEAVARALVTLHSKGDAASVSALSSDAHMSQRDLQFVPGTLVVPVGSSVSFPNEDDTGHHVYSFSDAKRFDLRIIPGGESESVMFDQVGTVAIGCNIHDAMVGFIHVVDTPWALESDDAGRVDWSSVPAGNYELRIWHERLRERGQTLTFDIELADDRAEETYELNLRRARRHGGRY